MKKRYFDDEISPQSIKEMITCFNPEIKNFDSGNTILRYSDETAQVGIVLIGSAKLYFLDENGDTSLLENYGKDDIFGEVFSLPLDSFEYLVIAESKCRILFIDYKHIISPCEKACRHHSQLINNLFIMTAQKTQELSLHISILNQHTIRKKLTAYLKYIQSASTNKTFSIPMSLSALSEYLCVDRSAMMREIKLMNSEGLISSKRREFTLNY